MKRGSLIGPALLILIGAAFLANNVVPGLSLLRIFGDWWPWVLIAWGAIRVVEITLWKIQEKPLPSSGISAGEWVFIVFLCLIGSSVFVAYRYSDKWPDARIRLGGLDLLGETFDFPYAEQKRTLGPNPRVLVENLRGNVRIVGADGRDLRVTGRATVRAFDQPAADALSKKCPLEVVTQGDLIVIRTNHDRASGPLKLSSDLEITVPRDAIVEGRGRYGDFEFSDVAAASIDSDNAGVRLTNIPGNVKVETRKSDVIRLTNVGGTAEVKGSGWDVELDDVRGAATVTGSYTGDLTFRKLAKPFRFESQSTELRCERISGQIHIKRGDMTAHDIAGPFYLKAKSKDVELGDITGPIEITLDRGDIHVRPGRLPLARIAAKTANGDIMLALPPAAQFALRARTGRGEIENEYGAPLSVTSEGNKRRSGTVEGKVGTGPEITLETERGSLVIAKADPAGPAEAPEPPKPPKPPAGVQAPKPAEL